jgi:hypothetical protein
VIIDDRNLPKDAKDPFTRLKFALNNGIRKELDAKADDVVTESRGEKPRYRRRAADNPRPNSRPNLGK